MRALGRRGVTLLEAVVAIAIAAIVLGLAVPGYLGYLAGRQLQNAAFLLVGDLRLAQQTAIAQSGDGPRVEVCLRPDGYDIYRVVFTSPVARDPNAVAQGAVVKSASAGGEYHAGITATTSPGDFACLIDRNRAALAFLGSGAPYPGGHSVRLRLRGRDFFVDVEPGSGLATVRP